MRSVGKRIVSKFKPKFKGPYEVKKVENNNMVIWIGGKSITVNVDQVRIYHPRERDEGVVDTDGLDVERSRAEQVETEGSKGLAREETSKKEKWRGKRMMSKGLTESCNNKERLHQSKRRPPVRLNWRKRSALSSLVENIEVRRLPHESCALKWKQFVANRVTEMQNHIQPLYWRHYDGKIYTALITRSYHADELLNSKKLSYGSPFLTLLEEKWPISKLPPSKSIEGQNERRLKLYYPDLLALYYLEE
ncbi:hypothetical protein NPIL_171171 [Nephila pilipes]|uniref:Uncharacterized protein n=1 Tax=Nephila pilipes TaxID=299642 RepID=A0A8X6Q5N2_NEPPI|nr:hypothetical protein NPIL_171171 [Nephila pilipes]